VNDAGSRAAAALVILHGFISIVKLAIGANARKIPPDKGGVAASITSSNFALFLIQPHGLRILNRHDCLERAGIAAVGSCPADESEQFKLHPPVNRRGEPR
ncbi:MAG TPA: hypothetical protein VFX90_08315, partial [Rhodoferax sp.]|nr:hypothetical protein [Rhodoferax sp.]